MLRTPCWLRALATGLLLLGLTEFPTASANARETRDSGAESSFSVGGGDDGTASLTASVQTSWQAPGQAATTSTTTTSSQAITVRPVCWYELDSSGADLAAFLTGFRDHTEISAYDTIYHAIAPNYPDWQTHATEQGSWYTRRCERGRAPDDQTYQAAVDAFYDANPYAIWVPDSQTPPEPQVDATTLAHAAWESVTIPTPTIDYNPKTTTGSATIVGIDTWVWASPTTPQTITVTATAGTTTATVTATATGLRLNAPDSVAHCTGFGVEWTPQADPLGTNCSITFTRSSAHLGATTPLEVSASYNATWTSTDGSSGNLGSATTTTTTPIPVAEIQTLNTTNQPKGK